MAFYLARSPRGLHKMLAWHGCDNLFLQRFMEPAVVDSDPATLRGVEDIGVALAKANIRMIVGFSRMHCLSRHDIISGHHHHERNA